MLLSKRRHTHRGCGCHLVVLSEGCLQLGVAAQWLKWPGLLSELTVKFTWWLPVLSGGRMALLRSSGMGKEPRVCSWWEVTYSVLWFSTEKINRCVFKCTVALWPWRLRIEGISPANFCDFIPSQMKKTSGWLQAVENGWWLSECWVFSEAELKRAEN